VATSVAATSEVGRSSRVAGLALAGGGLLAIAVGAVFGGLAQSASDAQSRAAAAMQVYDPDRDAAGRTDQIVEGALVGVGAAALVAGVVLFVVGRRAATDTSNARLAFNRAAW
jgi:hypothetical protein